MRIGIVAGEASGDLLGAELMKAIKARVPEARFEGIAGPQMIEQGCEMLYPAEKLAVMGLIGVGKYMELRSIRAGLARKLINDPPDVFIGIDAPDFNIGLETRLRNHNIPTIHYVSPSVWAWRQYRLPKIARAVDLMMTLFPFEASFYETHNVPVRFVGHPLADMIPLQIDNRENRSALDLPQEKKIIALLPGSRVGEVSRLADYFVTAAAHALEQRPGLHFAVPLANPETRALFETALQTHAPHLPVSLFDGQSREVMAAADVVLLASGTATLEGLLLKKPMVVAYRLKPFSYWLAKRLLKVDMYSLPNLLSGKRVIPEIIQHDVTAESLSNAVLDYLDNPDKVAALQQQFSEIHDTLRQNASENAADAVLSVVERARAKRFGTASQGG